MPKNKPFICGVTLRQGMKWSTSQEKTQYKLGVCYMLYGVTVLLLKHLLKLHEMISHGQMHVHECQTVKVDLQYHTTG